MSETPPAAAHGHSPLWLLLILPLFFVVGVLVGKLPTPKMPETKAAESRSPPTVSASAAPDRSTLPTEVTHGRGMTVVRRADPAPVAVEPPREDTPRAEISQWTTLNSAIAESQRNGKPVLIDFNAEWCGPCRRMKQELFDDWTRGQAVQSAVIPVSIVDRAREEGSNPPEIESLQSRYQVDAFPTLVVFSPATGRSLSKRGFGDADRTLAWITEAAKAVR